MSRAFLDDLTAESKLTAKLLAAVPADQGDWKPHEKSMTLAELAGHLADMPNWALTMVEDVLDMQAMMAEWKPFVSSDPQELTTTLEKSVTASREALEGRDDAFLRADWTMTKGDDVLMKAPRHEVLRNFIIHHSAHHRGQLTVYLRLLDVPVPATYGSSADESMMG